MTRPIGDVPDLIAACWTSGGNADARSGIVPSPVPMSERIQTVAATGWRGFGLMHADLVAARESWGLPALRAMFADNGIQHIELEYLLDWWTTGGSRRESDRVRGDLFDSYAELGARHIKVGPGLPGPPVSRQRLIDSWGELCELASERGIRLALESEPFSYLPTVESAVDVVQAVGAENGGILLDVWHVHRSGLPYDRLPLVVPEHLLFAVELSDASEEVVGSLFEDTINNRRYCGEGAFDVPQFIRTIEQMGFDGPWGVEIISDEHRALPVGEGLNRAYDTAVQCFAEAQSHPGVNVIRE
jgi:sugar phosphate isomerase/epimerase